jgi:alanine racemase
VRPGALRRNFRRINASVGASSVILPMVKADAYGLGMESVVRALEPENPWGFGVASLEEGERLRAAGVQRPILVASPLPPGAYDRAVAASLTPSLSEIEAIDRLVAAADRVGLPVDFHVEIDTGMGRSGFDWRRVEEWAPALKDLSADGVVWAGVYTHFHSADVDGDDSTLEQWTRLHRALEGLGDGAVGLLHGCNGAAALRYPSLAADAVRPGIFLYGGGVGEGVETPEAVVTLHSQVTLIREVPVGTTLGYGATYRAAGEERWAALGIGYGDGFPRILGNRGRVLLRGQSAPIIGRISMDVTVVDISDVDGVRVGDTATLIGTDGQAGITLDEVAAQAGTISYEILTGLTGRLPRVWMEDDVV